MPRIRYLKPDFFKDEDLAELPHWIRLLYAGLWTLADKAGRLEDRPKRLKADIFPYEDKDIEQGLQLLTKPKTNSNRPFIIRYEIEKEKYIQILQWDKHQKPHHTEKESIIPPIPPLMEKGMGMEKQLNASMKLRNREITVKKPLSTLSDKDFLQTLKENLAYKHINIDIELGKMDAWLLTHEGRQKTRRFIINWLNKVDKPIVISKSQLKFERPRPINEEEHKKVSKLIHETTLKMKGVK